MENIFRWSEGVRVSKYVERKARPGALRCGKALIAAISALATAAAAAEPAAEVDSIFSAYSQPGQPGCAVGVFQDGRPLLIKGYGEADLATGRKIDGDTVFYAASMSKQFTALAVAKLVEQGKIRLDDKVQRWIPDFPDYGTPITVAMLLHHTSGIRDMVILAIIAGLDVDQMTRPQALALIERQKGLNFAPGSQFSYSNSGFFLLSEIVSRASGKPFETFVHENVLDPLGMTNSHMLPEPAREGASIATSYQAGEHGFKVLADYPHISGSGGLTTTVNDLAKFDHDFQVDHRVWTPKTLQLLTTPGLLNDGTTTIMPGEGLNYGGGLMVGRRAGQYWVTHDGANSGFRTDYARLPDLKFGVAMLCNRGDSRAVTKTMSVIRVYHAASFDQADIGGPPPPPRPPSASGPLSPDLIASLEGDYRSAELDATYRLRGSSGGLTAIIQARGGSEPKSDLLKNFVQIAPDKLRAGMVTLTLDPPRGGKVPGFVLSMERAEGIRFVRNDH